MLSHTIIAKNPIEIILDKKIFKLLLQGNMRFIIQLK